MGLFINEFDDGFLLHYSSLNEILNKKAVESKKQKKSSVEVHNDAPHKNT